MSIHILLLLVIVCTSLFFPYHNDEHFAQRTEEDILKLVRDLANTREVYRQTMDKFKATTKTYEDIRKKLTEVETVLDKYNSDPAPEDVVYRGIQKTELKQMTKTLEKCDNERNQITEEYDKVVAEYDEFRDRADDIIAEYNETKANIKRLKTDTKNTHREANKMYGRANDLRNKANDIRRKLDSCERKKEQLMSRYFF